MHEMTEMTDEIYDNLFKKLTIQWQTTFIFFNDPTIFAETITLLKEYKRKLSDEDSKEIKRTNFIIECMNFYQKNGVSPIPNWVLSKIMIDFFRYKIPFTQNIGFKTLIEKLKKDKNDYINQRMSIDFTFYQENVQKIIQDLEDKLYELKQKINSAKSIRIDKEIKSSKTYTIDFNIKSISQCDELKELINFHKQLEDGFYEIEKQQNIYYEKHKHLYKPKTKGNGYEKITALDSI